MGGGAEANGSKGSDGAVASTSAAEQILRAARRAFARTGYHGTSIKAIAAEAEVRSPSILHYHFESKEALFLAVVRQAIGDLTERATGVGLEVRDGSRGLGAIEAFFALLDEEDDLGALLLECVALSARGQAARDEVSALWNGLEALVADAIVRLLGQHAERLPLDPAALAGTVMDLMTGHAVRSSLTPDPGPLQRERRAILTLLGLLRPSPVSVSAPVSEPGSDPDPSERP